MFPADKDEMDNSRAEYATQADFCRVFERDMKSLYLLAFLLTANHLDAEQCFTSTVEAAAKEEAVFKGWVPAWVKRSLIKNAIQIAAAPNSSVFTGKRDLWTVEGRPGPAEIDAVTGLAPLERFVFVMSILERYSAWECSLLLGCGMQSVLQLRARALRGLTAPDALLPQPFLASYRNHEPIKVSRCPDAKIETPLNAAVG